MRRVQRQRSGSSPARALLALLPLLGALAACQDDPLDPGAGPVTGPSSPSTSPIPETVDLEGESPPFVAVPRKDADEQGGDVTLIRQMLSSAPARVFDPGDSFYLAVHRRELGKRWFLSAYMRQFFPGEVDAGAAQSMGTRVISFRVQNGKLYLFDVDDRKQTSDSFGDDVLVDAYPIIDPATVVAAGAQARALRDYVLVDPGAGLNRFGVVADAFASGALYVEKPFQVELKFCQRFRPLDDGVTFEQAFTGYSERPRPKDSSVPPFQEEAERVEPNLFRSSGILGLSLRRYQEGEGFQTFTVPFASPYFTGSPQLVPSEGRQVLPAARWNIRPGGPPVEWLISPLVEKFQALPDSQAAGIDLVAAVKRGIESWNVAFGFTALTARLARPDESFADDDKNYFIYDQNPNIGGAFANFRTNPNTGEIRGASVYFNDGFRQAALEGLRPRSAQSETAETAETPVARRPARTPSRPGLTWQPFPRQPLCDLPARSTTELARLREVAPADAYRENVEKYLAQIVAHEIGHTLGLRHNFKGSLLPPSSSVMEYIDGDVRLASDMPGSYDVDAIRYLYGLSSEPPAQPFCTDDGVGVDPTCQRFDRGADPLRDFYGRYHPQLVRAYLQEGDIGSAIDSIDLLFGLITYVQRAQTLPERVFAFQTITSEITATAAPVARPPSFTSRVNTYSSLVMRVLFPPEAALPPWLPPPGPQHPHVDSLVATELSANLMNQDGLRTFATRRLAVDTLKRMQALPGYEALRSARTVLASPYQPTPEGQEALLEDLRARVEAAITPYFE
jgi:hypothetical protein